MIKSDPQAVIADVRTEDTLERIICTPRSFGELHVLTGLLRESLHPIRVQSSPEGPWLRAFDSDALLVVENSKVDLRWSAEARVFAENRAKVKATHPALAETVRMLRELGPQHARKTLTGGNGLDVLDDHQCVNVAAMTAPGSFGLCLFDEQGAGKTVTLIYAFDRLVANNVIDFAIIVAPKSMVPEWPKDFTTFKGDLYRVALLTGSRREKKHILASGPDVIVTNFETVISFESELRATLQRRRSRTMLVVDESFYAKNMDAKRTKAIRRLREWCDRAYVLCGTPAPNSPQDLVQQFNIVDFGITFSGVRIPKDRDASRPIVQKAIQERGLYVRHLKSSVLPDLPVKRFHRVFVALEPEQEILYRATLHDLIADLRATDETTFKRKITSFLARRMALLQICSNPKGIHRDYTEIPAKLKALESLLVDLVTVRREKVVLWSFFTRTIEAIVEKFASLGAVRYDGTVSDVATRRDAVRRFQEDDETMLFVANPAAAGAGLTLHRSRYAVYESMSNQAAHYLQSLDRIHRRGQKRDVEYVILLAENTIELLEYDRLLRKERSAQELLGDEVSDVVTRDAMLGELLSSLGRVEEKADARGYAGPAYPRLP